MTVVCGGWFYREEKREGQPVTYVGERALGGVQQVLLVVQQLDQARANLAAHQRTEKPTVLLAEQLPLLSVLTHLPLLQGRSSRGRGGGGFRAVESMGYPNGREYA